MSHIRKYDESLGDVYMIRGNEVQGILGKRLEDIGLNKTRLLGLPGVFIPTERGIFYYLEVYKIHDSTIPIHNEEWTEAMEEMVMDTVRKRASMHQKNFAVKGIVPYQYALPLSHKNL